MLLRPGTAGTDAPVLGPVMGLPRVVHVGDDLELTLGFIDNSRAETHTVAISWDDGCAQDAPPTLHESGGVGKVKFRHRFCTVGTAGAWIRITDSARHVTELLKQTYVDDSAGLTLQGRGMLSAGRGTTPLHFSLWVPLAGDLAAVPSGATRATPFVRLGGAIRFDSEQLEAPAGDGEVVSVEGTGRLNGRPGYRFRLETVDNTLRSDAPAQLRWRVFHIDSRGNERVDYDTRPAAQRDTVRPAGTGEVAKIASGWVDLAR